MRSPDFPFRQQGESCHPNLAGELGKGPQGLVLGRVRMKGLGGRARDRAGKGVLGAGRGGRVQGRDGDQDSQKISVYLGSSLCLSAPPVSS